MAKRVNKKLHPKFEIFHNELRFEDRTVYLPNNWYWFDSTTDGYDPDGKDPITLFEAYSHDEGHVYYDGIDYLRIEECSYDDCGSAQRAVKEANKFIIKEIEKRWKRHKEKNDKKSA